MTGRAGRPGPLPLRTSIHTHSLFCDGADPLEGMAAAALSQGLAVLGFSGHAYLPEEGFGISPAALPEYLRQARALQRAYAGRLDILCGLEVDPCTPPDQLQAAAGLDYFIGSSHSAPDPGGRQWTVDDTPELLARAVGQGFGGDGLACARAYYRQLAAFALARRPAVVGHFDLIVKFNGSGRYFDEESAAYRQAALEALDPLLAAGLPFEVNTGGMARGWRQEPYPALFLLRRIREKGGRVTVTADAHSAGALTFGYDAALAQLRRAGFRTVWELYPAGWREVPIP